SARLDTKKPAGLVMQGAAVSGRPSHSVRCTPKLARSPIARARLNAKSVAGMFAMMLVLVTMPASMHSQMPSVICSVSPKSSAWTISSLVATMATCALTHLHGDLQPYKRHQPGQASKANRRFLQRREPSRQPLERSIRRLPILEDHAERSDPRFLARKRQRISARQHLVPALFSVFQQVRAN